MTALEEAPWRMEVTTADDGGVRWYSNALRFKSREAALDYGADLAARWLLVTRWRAVDNTVPEREPYRPGDEDGTT